MYYTIQLSQRAAAGWTVLAQLDRLNQRTRIRLRDHENRQQLVDPESLIRRRIHRRTRNHRRTRAFPRLGLMGKFKPRLAVNPGSSFLPSIDHADAGALGCNPICAATKWGERKTKQLQTIAIAEYCAIPRSKRTASNFHTKIGP